MESKSLASLKLEMLNIENLIRQERKMGIIQDTPVLLCRFSRMMDIRNEIRDEILGIMEKNGWPIPVKGIAKNGANQTDNSPIMFDTVADAEYFIEMGSGNWEYYIDI